MNTKQRQLEQRIVEYLLAQLEKHGWGHFRVDQVGTGDPRSTRRLTAQQVLDAIFEVDEAWLFVRREHKQEDLAEQVCAVLADMDVSHSILLVCGNGEDIIGDWSYREGDADGFKALMDKICDDIETFTS